MNFCDKYIVGDWAATQNIQLDCGPVASLLAPYNMFYGFFLFGDINLFIYTMLCPSVL